MEDVGLGALVGSLVPFGGEEVEEDGAARCNGKGRERGPPPVLRLVGNIFVVVVVEDSKDFL